MVAKKKAKKKAPKKGAKRDYSSKGSSIPKPVKNNKTLTAKTDWENTTEFEILAEVPIPWTRITSKEIIFPFTGMKIGHSFQFMREADKGQNVYSAALSYCRQPENFHKRFVVRKIAEEYINDVPWVKWGCWREDDLTQQEIDKKQADVNAKQKIATKKRHNRTTK